MLSSLTGPITGPVSEYVGGTGNAVFDITDIDYDVALGGIPFKLAVSDSNPYQRQTAPFRKDQIDQQQNVGDQSIAGYWLRGQLSFHGGAGVTYYEVEEGESVINRFTDSLGIEVSVPGQAELGSEVATHTLTGTATSMVGGFQGNTSGVYYSNGANAFFVPNAFASPSGYGLSGVTMVATDPRPNRPAYAITGPNVYQLNATAGSITLLYTRGGGPTWVGIWFGKSRLFLLDSNGAWFAAAASPTTPPVVLNDSDKFWSGVDVTSGWSASDSPGSFYMAQDRTIYEVSLDNTGAVPTLSAAIISAQLPYGETITSIGFYLSTLMIVTNRGVRAGFVGSSGITYGPQIISFTGSGGNTIAAQDSFIYVTGQRSTDSKIVTFKLDLSVETISGAFAYSPAFELATATGNAQGVLNCGDGTLVAFSGSSYFTLVGTLSGTLTTGFHRFGTLEPKVFHSVSVRLDGLTGACNVTLVKKGGVEVLLASLTPSAGTDQSLLFHIDEPAEFVGLKFSLTRPNIGDPGPILRGYQIKALPAPERTRLIQWPLWCVDRQTDANGVEFGYEGFAYERLVALEDLESAAGEVLFTDFRTSEQGLCYIEQISFSNTSSSTRQDNGFGGIVTVVLRKVT